jgi:hypothetical protein
VNYQVPKTQKPKCRNPKIFEDKRTVEDLTVGSLWTKTMKPKVPKIHQKLQSRAELGKFMKLKHFLKLDCL